MRNLFKELVLTFLLSIIVFKLTAHAQKAELVVSIGHPYSVQSAMFSHDGKLLASAIYNQVKLWDVVSRSELRMINDCGNKVIFSSNDANLVCIDEKNIKILSVYTGEVICLFTDDSASIHSIALASNTNI